MSSRCAPALVLLLASLAGCGAGARGDAARSGLVVGVTQVGGVPPSRADGTPLLSEAYVVYPDGRLIVTENFADAPWQRRARAAPSEAQQLIALLTSKQWQELPSERREPPAPDDVKLTVEVEGKTVSRWASAQEPIFREVLDVLQRIRISASGV